MTEALYELLSPYINQDDSPPQAQDEHTIHYLTRLSTLALSDLTSTEPSSLSQSATSHLRNLQALSKRSHKAVISSSSHVSSLSALLPDLRQQAGLLRDGIPSVDSAVTEFSQKYDRSTENAVLDRRKRAELLSRNVERVSDVLDLPSLLSSTVAAAQRNSGASSVSVAGPAASYSSALDIHAHIRRMRSLYPQSKLIGNISAQSEVEMQNLATVLITSLQSPSLKLAAAMRTVGWLKRVAPELAEEGYSGPVSEVSARSAFSLGTNTGGDGGAIGSLFLVCRLHVLDNTLEALDPLRELADQETAQRIKRSHANGGISKQQAINSNTSGSQTERYLKRYLEVFREQSFAILSMYRNIFSTHLPVFELGAKDLDGLADPKATSIALSPIASPVSEFALHLVDKLSSTLREYMPNISDWGARESLLTQVLYCGSSLGRLGAEFSMMIALLEEELEAGAASLATEDGSGRERDDVDHEPVWAQVMKKQRIQASRLEVLSRGVGGAKKSGVSDLVSPVASS